MNTSTPRRLRAKKEQVVEARVSAIGSVRRADTSRQIAYEDEFETLATGVYIAPPFDVRSILSIYEKSNMLKQCVAAYVTNVAMYGFEIVRAHPDVAIDEEERAELQSFIDNANSEESLLTVHAKVVEDYEALGYAFVEVIRDQRRRVSLLRHVRASTVRLTAKDEESVKVEYEVRRGPRTATVVEMRRFRKYMQVIGGKVMYFKEFGDPRRLDCITGVYESKDHRVTPDIEATEIIHIRHNSEDPYGVPRWISQLPSILGSREAEEVNLRYFEDNTVPPMMLLVAGGRLTTQSYNDLVKILSSQGLGKDRQHQAILVEAVAERDSLDDKGTPVSLKVEKLTDARPSDALFKDYDEANQAKVRSAFRLPPVAVGLSEDHTYASANVSQFVAETQVFSVLRRVFDEVYNKRLVNHALGLNLKTVWLQLKAPAITNPEQIVKTLTALNVMGGLTPRKAVEAASKLLQIELENYPEVGAEGYDEWMDRPIQLSLRGDAPQNTQDEQSVKDAATKATEDDGDISLRSPENGQQ